MMGNKQRIFSPIDALTLDQLVPADHFYRHVERTLDLAFVRDLVAACYAAGGRPSIDPVVFFKLQLVMFFEGIRSERQLLAVAADRLSIRWYLGYDLNEPLPDHSSLTRIRDRYGIDIFRRFFDVVVERCQQAGLVWGDELYLDATKVRANASVQSVCPRFVIDAHLDTLFAGESPEPAEPTTTGATSPIIELPTSRSELDDEHQRRHDWIASSGSPPRDADRGRNHYQRVSDRQGSPTDPDASLMMTEIGSRFGYHTHYVVDGGRDRIILAALVTPFAVMENQPALDLIWRSCFRWKLRPSQVTGDTTYGTIEIITALEQAGIRAYIPLPNLEERTGYFGKGAFDYDAERDVYRCPAGSDLRCRGKVYTERIIRYRADAATCNACELKAQCTASEAGRGINRSFDEPIIDRVRGYQETEPYQRAIRKRQVWVEPLFAEGKQWHGLRRVRLRRLARVNGEVLLIAAGQNLKRLLCQRGWGHRPWPGGAAGIRSLRSCRRRTCHQVE